MVSENVSRQLGKTINKHTVVEESTLLCLTQVGRSTVCPSVAENGTGGMRQAIFGK